jgi:hypothetical protein
MAEPVAKERMAGSTKRVSRRYEDDYYGWVMDQVELLRSGRLDQIEREHLAEELEDLAGDEFTKLESALRVLLMHMLKWDQQPEHRTRSWIFSIREQRRRYARLLKKSPSLKARLEEAREEAYEDARDWAAHETHLSVRDFPKDCPYGWDDVLERPFEFDSVQERSPPRDDGR